MREEGLKTKMGRSTIRSELEIEKFFFVNTSIIWSLTMMHPLLSAMLPSITLLTKIPLKSSEKDKTRKDSW